MNADTARELRHSILWKEVVAEIDKKVVCENMKLRTCSPEELGAIQAKVLCYESLTRLPADVIDREE